MSDIIHFFADVILPDEIEILPNEAGRQAIENLVDRPIEWDDFATQASAVLRLIASTNQVRCTSGVRRAFHL